MGIEEKRAARAAKIDAHKAMVSSLNDAAEEALMDAEDIVGIGRAKIFRSDSDTTMCACVCVIALGDDIKARITRYRDKMHSEKTGPAAKRIEQDELARALVFWPHRDRPCKVDGASVDYDALKESYPGVPLSICLEGLKLAGIIDAEDVGK